MFSATTLLPLLLVLALEAEAVPSNRRSWGAQRPNKRENAPRAVSTTTTRASGDFQTYNTGAGGVFAPAVTTNGNYWYQSGTQYNYIYDALVGSCNTQATNCVLSLSVLDKTVCWGSVSANLNIVTKLTFAASLGLYKQRSDRSQLVLVLCQCLQYLCRFGQLCCSYSSSKHLGRLPDFYRCTWRYRRACCYW